MTPTQRILNKIVDIEKLLDKLDIDEVDVVTAAREQPGLYLKAARYRVKKMRSKRKAISELEQMRTELALQIRKKDTVNKRKRTESNIKELLMQKPELVQTMRKVSMAEEEEELAKRLLDAFDHRGKSIRVIADLIGVEVAMEKKMGEYRNLVDLKKDVKSKYPGEKA